jgi:hypothetical protein
MKTNKLFLLLALVAVLFQCALRDFNVGYGGSGTETVGGYTLDKDSKPLAGVFVSIRRSDFLDAAEKSPGTIVADTITDANGKYSLVIGEIGTFTIEMFDNKGNAALERCTVNQYDSLSFQSTLRPVGMVSGRVIQYENAEQVKYKICIYGFSRHSVLTDDSGYFSIRDLPEGEYHFKIIPLSSLYEPYDTDGISVISGESKELSPVQPQKACFGIHPGDSIALRAILDSNGLQSIPVDSIAVTEADWPYRVNELSIKDLKHNNIYFQTLTSKIMELTELRKITVINNIRVQILPIEIGTLKKLHELYISETGLKIVPPEIGNLNSLKILILTKNWLDSLPMEIGNIDSLEVLDISNNPIKNHLPSSIGNCIALKNLNVSLCQLKSLPGELARCINLRHISAGNNLIDSIPLSIVGSLGVPYDHTFIDFTMNSFCSDVQDRIPKEVFDWLDKYCTEPMWRVKQNCSQRCIPPME